MRKKFTKLMAALALLIFMAPSMVTWGQTYTWQETDLSDLVTGDYVVIVGTTSGSTYAMSNNNGTSSAPSATAVTVSNGALSGTIATTIQWVITVNSDNCNFGVPSTSNYLYCTDANNGMRVGTNANKAFTYVSGGSGQSYYLQNTATSRYIGIYNNQDWRCYTSVNNNIKNQSFAFYKKVQVVTNDPYITANDIPITYDTDADEIAY
jgi:hypothetical protein